MYRPNEAAFGTNEAQERKTRSRGASFLGELIFIN